MAFAVGNKKVYRVPKSLEYFTHENRFRVLLVRIVESDGFNNVIMFVIVLNAINIAAYNNSKDSKTRNVILEYVSDVFTAIYVLEAMAKIIASGLLIGKNTYLRDPTNIFDFVIVWISILQLFFSLVLEKQTTVIFVFRCLKVFRIARLLTIFYKIPVMRQQLRTLGQAFQGLMNVLLFLCIFFVFLSLIGLQLFGSDIYNACRLTPFPIVQDGRIVWPRAHSDVSPGSICVSSKSKIKLGGFNCPSEQVCGSFLDFEIPLELDEVQYSSQLYFNVFNWSHFGGSLLSVLQIVTADTWGNHLYNLINSSNFIFPTIFCFLIHMVGTYYLLNLMLVVIIESYIKSKEDYADQELQQQQVKINKFQKSLIDSDTYVKELVIIHDYIDSEEFLLDMEAFVDSDDEQYSPAPVS